MRVHDARVVRHSGLWLAVPPVSSHRASSPAPVELKQRFPRLWSAISYKYRENWLSVPVLIPVGVPTPIISHH